MAGRAVPSQETVRSALALACRAPSVHNSQPWRWKVAEHSVHLYLDSSRLLPVLDPTGREMVISCGAALNHARIAFAAEGWKLRVHRLPNPAQPDHLASIEFTRLDEVDEHVVTLAAAAATRRSDRRPVPARSGPGRGPRALARGRAAGGLHAHVRLGRQDTPGVGTGD
ncbi:hypothetical protein AB0I53_33405 [Saccharopolyspora sp. NPDC050389]|uniref:hypothetical protein n=1 Tax=Saccharopolyspora sp. NPDC050389 TaxID=3155516 RepID=UPI0033CA1EBA